MFRPSQGMGIVKSLGTVFTFLLLGAFTSGDVQQPALVLIAAFWSGALLFLFRYSKDTTASYQQSLIFFGGLLYIPLNFHFFLTFSQTEIILIIGAAAISDTAAFYAGSLWGKKKIWPQISPKKSWAGSIGGFTACSVAITAYGLYFGSAEIWQWGLLGAALNIAAQMGDFFESALKRSLDIKDSSQILPGHGGLLDRVDSLLLVIPTYALFRMFHTYF